MSLQTDQIAVVIPVYKEVLSATEILSLKQCIKILSRYPLVFVKPKSLQLDSYREIVQCYDVEEFDDIYFKHIVGYNKLMLSLQFYKRFVKIGLWVLLIISLECFMRMRAEGLKTQYQNISFTVGKNNLKNKKWNIYKNLILKCYQKVIYHFNHK